MTLVNTVTGELVEPMSADEARRLTERIRYTALGVRDGMEKLQRLVQEAQDGQAHVALGYASWTAYLADTLGKEPLRLPRDQRQELVGYLAGEGMSTRAIAPIVGVSHQAVANDLAGVKKLTPETPQGQEPPSLPPEQPDDVEEAGSPGLVTPPAPGPAAKPITGIDGKTYTRSEPKQRATPRRALTDQFFTAAYDAAKKVESLHRLIEDDRFPQNAEKVAAKHRNDLLRTRDLLQQVINALPSEESTHD